MARNRRTLSEEQVIALEAHLAGTLRPVTPPIDVAQTFGALTAAWDALLAVADPAVGLTRENARILVFSAGRFMLWVVVVTAIWSMVDYFHRFYGKIRDQIEVRERRGRRRRVLRRRARTAAPRA